MTTPIYDFVRQYAASDAVRMHMPGHKGVSVLGCEAYDLTEIAGADELFAPEGIIAESEANAGRLFGCRTLYSAEGSSLCIRAMLYLAVQDAAAQGKPPVIAAARNAHKTFLTAAALLGFEILWLPREENAGYLSGGLSQRAMQMLAEQKPAALYLTSPDYLGNRCDLREAAAFCRAHGILLLVDAAHGAYLRFLPESQFPTDLGAHLCCTSAHKTLPVLTGGAYLHISGDAPEICQANGRHAMALFASTSPSYLILSSLDLCNRYLAEEFPHQLRTYLPVLADIRERLTAAGWTLTGTEPMKLTVAPKSYGYTGTALAEILQNAGIFCEYADPDHLVLMPAPLQGNTAAETAARVLLGLPKREPVAETPPPLPMPERVMHPRAVLTARTEHLPVTECVGRICAEFAVSCPPAVPIVMSGERVDAAAVRCMQYYGTEYCTVICE